jgi:hypothetical protein
VLFPGLVGVARGEARRRRRRRRRREEGTRRGVDSASG